MPDVFDQLGSVDSLVAAVNDAVECYVTTRMTRVTAEDLGLDPRCASEIYVDRFWIAIPKRSQSRMEYYGGFEYISRDCIESQGGYVFYSAEDGRVERCIDHWQMQSLTAV